ncbi:WD domain, G-beta repeat protein (macronuclear) [Tetrahymena thermophila SB210]|uniref:WD domain, G-beta repeat protein n=1 Tax=Tetrahymena thermophila (strain SB210) TaxID=312017 RepID=I7LXI1_TETTS|nr:WD domain, G-beta repeat protein [Tetrahymena thermophila SB210]EAS04686.2 WD domain, G-beta repeat protein [Tetrahymena thermophila SB210]|eukprot:XP_001024931.2 WD domain, G-beta repeat protein [Tetrahymena thermophila SB210]
MGNQNTVNGGTINLDDEDISDERLQSLYNQYLRSQYQPQQRQPPKKLSRKPYSIQEDQQNENYMIFTDNLFEAKIKKQIYKKQKSHYQDYNRRLKYLTSKSVFNKFEYDAPHLELPPSYNYHSKVMENMIPNKRRKIDELRSPVYNILFSQDGNQLLITTQEELFTYNYNQDDGEYKRGKVLYPRNITWTITDSDLSQNGRYLIHCSLNPFISIFDIQTGKYNNFYNLSDGEEDEDYYYHSLRFFSCKYSGDDSKILASSGKTSQSKAQIKMFDVQRERVSDSILAHDDDINSIAFVDKHNSSVFISGSDDRSVKIWDTRALGPNGQSAGELLGHVAGITHVDSRQDNYYVASNGKDQCVKLWDLRKSVSSSTGKNRVQKHYDYRMGAMTEKEVLNIRNLTQEQNFDNSVQTFRGHKVGKTLMRCHFSPLGPTDRRYIYTASYCGKVFLYDILSNTTKHLEFQEEKNQYTAGILNDMEQTCVRDAAWHPKKMEIITTNLKGKLFKWFNNDLYFEEIEDLEKQNKIEDESNSEQSRAQSQFENYRWEYEDEDNSTYNRVQDDEDEEDEDYDDDIDKDYEDEEEKQEDKDDDEDEVNGEDDDDLEEEEENRNIQQNQDKFSDQDSNKTQSFKSFQDQEESNS